MSLEFTFQNLKVGIPRLPGMLFNFIITNPHPRTSRIWSYDFELFHVTNPQTMDIQYLGPLSANMPIPPEWLCDFHQSQVRPCELVWNFERKQIQSIEDARHGDDVFFEIHGNLLVASDHQGAQARREVAWDSPRSNSAYPIRLKIAQSEWVRLLDEMKFTHILLYELPAPEFPPAFTRSAAHLKDAWNHHRKNEPESALGSCYKAFECLGLDLLGSDAATRKQLVSSILSREPNSKQEAFLALLEELQDFTHLGRHARGQPSKIHREDSEMILLCATALLGYLVKQHSRGSTPNP